MIVSSRTPEGEPHRCGVCGRLAVTEPSYPGGDSLCPTCGSLLWRLRDRLGADVGLYDSLSRDAGVDSLTVVEAVMGLEDEFGVSLADLEAENIDTVAELMRDVARRRGDAAE